MAENATFLFGDTFGCVFPSVCVFGSLCVFECEFSVTLRGQRRSLKPSNPSFVTTVVPHCGRVVDAHRDTHRSPCSV